MSGACAVLSTLALACQLSSQFHAHSAWRVIVLGAAGQGASEAVHASLAEAVSTAAVLRQYQEVEFQYSVGQFRTCTV
jgi:hypothetical protein